MPDVRKQLQKSRKALYRFATIAPTRTANRVDASIDSGTNPRIIVASNSDEYAEWVIERLDWLYSSRSVVVNNDYPDADEVHRICTLYLPQLKRYEAWYNDGYKKVPSDIQLTPLKVKLWYAGDGTRNKDNNRISIAMFRQRNRMEKMKSLFTSIGFDPIIYTDGRLAFKHDEANKLIEYMGTPVPGYEYKFKVI